MAFNRETTVKARTARSCLACGKTIEVGEKCLVVVGKGIDFYAYSLCKACEAEVKEMCSECNFTPCEGKKTAS